MQYVRRRWIAVAANDEGLDDGPDACGFAHVPEEDGNILALVGLALAAREELDPPVVPPGGDDVGVDGLADGKLLALLVVYYEPEGRRAHGGDPRRRLCHLASSWLALQPPEVGLLAAAICRSRGCSW